MSDLLLLDHKLWSDQRLVLSAIAVHCIYTAFNYVRALGSLAEVDLQDFFQRAAYHAIKGHRGSSNSLSVA
eukprot:10546902-Karenia_brevis.AAC.1